MNPTVQPLLRPLVALPLGLCLIFCGETLGLDINFEFHHLTIDNGLTSNTINGVTRDSRGFIWISSENGVSRYDGYTFTNFRSNAKDSATIGSNITYVVFEDRQQRLWVGTEKGLDLFNRDLDRFDKHYLHNSPVRSIYQDSRGYLWIGTDTGLYLYDALQDTFSKPFSELFEQGRVTYNTVISITEDSAQNLWIGTHTEGIVVYDFRQQTFTRFVHEVKKPGSLSSNRVNTIIRDHQGRMWVATYGGGVNVYQPASGTFKHYQHRNGDPRSLATDLLTALWEDGAGNLWVGTDGKGIDILNIARGTFQHAVHTADDPKTLSNDVVRSISDDGRGGLWIGTFTGGLNFFNRNVEPFFHYSLRTFNGNSSVTSFAEDKQGNLWIGTDGGGLCYFNNSTGDVTNYAYDEKNVNSLSDDRIVTLVLDHKGMLWIGTYLGGLCRFNPATKQFTRYSIKDGSGLSDDIVWTLLEDRHNRLWVGTNNGLDYYDEKTNKFHWISTYNSNLTNDMIRVLYEDHGGHLWVGTHNGLNLMQSEFLFTPFRNQPGNTNSLSNNWIRTILDPGDGTMLIGTFEGGLNIYNRARNTFSLLTEAEGLPSNIISSVFCDERQNLWIATGRGLARLDARTRAIHIYSNNEGLQDNQFNINACFMTSRGELLVGGSNGFTRFVPHDIGEDDGNKFAPPVVFTDFKIFNRKVPPAQQGSPLARHINEARDVTIAYNHSMLTFEFSALNFVHPENNRYAYRLLGFETDWNYVGNKQSATYTNLDPGRYTLQVKACNNVGIWNEQGASLRLRILPPFWQTWWFITMVILIILSGAVYVYLIIRRRIREKLRVNRLIAELEIKSLISQMNPHFVFNCLTSIQELVMSGKLDKAMHYLTQFSRLLRIVLQSSDKSATSLSDELMLLEAYLELESLRFEGQFHYEIKVDEAIDPEETVIPSFLIQPFVENGLWHGLMQKKDNGIMTISFTLKEEDVLVCRVDDNGIGRAASARARKSIKARESMGIRVTSERIKLMKEQDDAADLAHSQQ